MGYWNSNTSLHGHLDNFPRNQRETLRCGTIPLNWKRRSNGKKSFIQEFRISQDFYENEKPLRPCIRVTCATKSFPWEPTVPTHYLRSCFSNFSFKLKYTFASLEFMFCKFWICCYVYPSRTPWINTLLSALSLFSKTLMLPFWRYLTLSLCLEHLWLFWASKYRLAASKSKKCLNSTDLHVRMSILGKSHKKHV